MNKSHARKGSVAMMSALIDKVFEAVTSQNAKVILFFAAAEEEDFIYMR